MKILFISNVYPPCGLGGYDAVCYEVATHLIARGHKVTVLTSNYRKGEVHRESEVYRELRLAKPIYPYGAKQTLRYFVDRHVNARAVKKIIMEKEPDVVVVWGMYELSRLVAVWTERLLNRKVVYYLSDQWPMTASLPDPCWDMPVKNLKGKACRWLLRKPLSAWFEVDWNGQGLRFEHVLISCQALRDELVQGGVPVHNAKVIYHGIDPSPYREAAKRPRRSGMDRLQTVFVGTLMSHKGAHTAVEAIGRLMQNNPQVPVTLSILGQGPADYEERLRRLVQEWQITDMVSFHKPIPRSSLPSFLAQFDALLLPSTYEEPMARISQEAMAANVVLVGTLTGGTKEILVDGQNGLAFKPEDAASLAGQLQRLAQDPSLREGLITNGRQTVASRFTISRMVDEIETYLADFGNYEAGQECG
jgi:glycogen synthase